MKLLRTAAVLWIAACSFFVPLLRGQPQGAHFDVSFPASLRSKAVTGRVFVFITLDGAREPRFQSGGTGLDAPFFGTDVSELKPGEAVRIDETTLGYPLASLKDLPAGDYYVQGLLNVYTQFHRSDGNTIWAHMDQWEGQQFAAAPNNLLSEVQRVHIDPSRSSAIHIELSSVLPPVTVPADTQWVKHVKIQSKLLSVFWGCPMYLGAVVLVPKGYDQYQDVHYPVDYEQDHFSLAAPYRFQVDPVSPVDEERVGRRAWLINMRQAEGYRLYQDWSAGDFPRMVMVTFLHPTPFYDDSYAVNSANNGPYGDAIMTELIPYIETHFRIIREPFARVLSGGSTGGWESLALQLYHPEFFGGAWVYYPDPIDFHWWDLTDIYSDSNAYTPPASRQGTNWVDVERPFLRTAEGQVQVTVRQQNQLEEVLGSRGRSGEQQEAWEAVYGPAGEDGYPKPLWNRMTGEIDHSVAEYMRANGYDLTEFVRTHWAAVGPNLAGKLHFYCGDMDSFYLNLAVYRMQGFLESTTNPYYGGSFQYGRPMKGHGFRPTTTGEMLRTMAHEIEKNAPVGMNTQSWHY